MIESAVMRHKQVCGLVQPNAVLWIKHSRVSRDPRGLGQPNANISWDRLDIPTDMLLWGGGCTAPWAWISAVWQHRKWILRQSRSVVRKHMMHKAQVRRATWTDLPFDVQLLVLGNIPLAELARLAPLGKVMRAAFKERLKERQACIQERLAEGWATDLMKGVSPAEMALPRDLILTPPIPERLQFTPEANTVRYFLKRRFLLQFLQFLRGGLALPGIYQGFALRGKPDGRGEWIAHFGDSYTGDWRGGQPHGRGILHNACMRYIVFLDFQAGDLLLDVGGTLKHGRVGM